MPSSKAARGAEKKLIDGAVIFDVFSGAKAEAQMGEGNKSVAITVRLQPAAGTLTDEEIEAVSARVIAAVKKATGGEFAQLRQRCFHRKTGIASPQRIAG